jgi:ribosomal-protein-alanine N-acetyltransferase
MARRRDRVELSPLSEGDREEFLAAMIASRELHRPWLSPPTSDAAFDTLLARVGGEGSDFNLVRRVEDGALVGYFNLSQIIRGPLQSAFLGYGAVAAQAGRGQMAAGLELVLRRAFTELGLHRVEANVQPGNTASLALVAGAGFVREGFSERYLKVGGRWRDHERWAIRAEQWRERRPKPPARRSH